MYKEFELKEDVLYIKDDKENTSEFSNSGVWLEYFENKNNIEMLEKKLEQLIDIKENISKENLIKYSRNFIGVLLGVILMLSFLLKIVFSSSALLILGLLLSSLLTLKSVHTIKTDKSINNINEIIDLQVEIENTINKIKSKNNILFREFIEEKINKPIQKESGILKCDEQLVGNYSKRIEALRRIRESLDIKQKTLKIKLND